MTGNDKCPLKPFIGTKLINVPKATLRDWLYKANITNGYPELYRYIRTRFTVQELEIIDAEVAEGIEPISTTATNIARQIWNAGNGGTIVRLNTQSRAGRRPAVVVPTKKIDKAMLLNEERALEL